MKQLDQQRSYYNRIYGERGSAARTDHRPNIKDYFAERFLDMVIPSGSPNILEIGCGDGTLTHRLLGRGLKVHALDISSTAIEKLAARFAVTVSSGQLIPICDDMSNYLATRESSFDLVIGSGVIHHIDRKDRIAVFTHIHNALLPGGLFACGAEPNANGLYRFLWRFAGIVRTRLYRIHHDDEVEKGTFDMKSRWITGDLISAGFAKTMIKPYQSILHFSVPPVALADRLLVDIIGGRMSIYTIVMGIKGNRGQGTSDS